MMVDIKKELFTLDKDFIDKKVREGELSLNEDGIKRFMSNDRNKIEAVIFNLNREIKKMKED